MDVKDVAIYLLHKEEKMQVLVFNPVNGSMEIMTFKEWSPQMIGARAVVEGVSFSLKLQVFKIIKETELNLTKVKDIKDKITELKFMQDVEQHLVLEEQIEKKNIDYAGLITKEFDKITIWIEEQISNGVLEKLSF